MEQCCSIFAVCVQILPPYVDESKSLRRVYGQDPLICIGFGALNDGDILAP